MRQVSQAPATRHRLPARPLAPPKDGATGTPKSFPVNAPAYEDVPITSGAAGGPNALRYSPAFGHEHFHSQRIAAYTLLAPDGSPVQEANRKLATEFCDRAAKLPEIASVECRRDVEFFRRNARCGA